MTSQVDKDGLKEYKEVDENRLKEYKEIFHLYDENGDQKISSKELSTMMYALGTAPTDDEIETIISDFDKNKNGFIDFDEFVTLMEKTPNTELGDDELKEAFQAFDKDKNGTIDRNELKDALTNMGRTMSEKEVTELMMLADKNGDGVIQYEEFVAMMCTY